MAVDTGVQPAIQRNPGIGLFLRLKLRMLRNGLSRRSGAGTTRRRVTLVISVVFGFWSAAAGFALLTVNTASDDRPLRTAVVGVGCGILTLAWTLLPLIFFGVDETLDPARFALLPVPKSTLLAGLLAASAIGVPSLATLFGSLGLVAGSASRGGFWTALVALGCALLGLMLCVVASRAVTSAFSSMLRSRKMRDLAVLAMVVMVSSIAPLQLALSSMFRRGDLRVYAGIGRVMGWTPLAAAQTAALDALDGHWGLMVARLAIVLSTVALLLWWWSRTLESAMMGNSSGGLTSRAAAGPGQQVAAFLPAVLRWLPLNRFTAIVARDLRYYWRDPRWRASLASLSIATLFIPVSMAALPGGNGAGSVITGAFFVGTVLGASLANVLGTDGPAFAGQLLAGIPGRLEMRARITGLSLLAVPLICTASLLVGRIGDSSETLPTIGLALASFGTAAGGAVMIAVLLPYPLPQSSNPFAASSGGASLRGLAVLAGMLATVLVTSPVVVCYTLLPGQLSWLVLPIGLLWALAAVVLGTHLAGITLDRRGPEVLAVILPKE